MHFLYYFLLYFPCSFFITPTAFHRAAEDAAVAKWARRGGYGADYGVSSATEEERMSAISDSGREKRVCAAANAAMSSILSMVRFLSRLGVVCFD